MKALVRNFSKRIFCIGLMMLNAATISVAVTRYSARAGIQDTIISSDIRSYLQSSNDLQYPLAAERIYKENDYKAIWFSTIARDQLWDAMLLLDCSLQYGLNRNDYHPEVLNYNTLKAIAAKRDLRLAARLDVLLTDAMLAFISNLHFGKLAPFYTPETTDQADFKGMKADSVLKRALKNYNFSFTIAGVQPINKEYRSLQILLRLMTGQYTGDSYLIDIDTIKLIATNMERWRWERPIGRVYTAINIPSFTMHYQNEVDSKDFKVIVGKPSTPTPLLASKIGYFTTAPDWTVPDKILLKELLPLALKHPGYLDNNNFRIYDKRGNTVGSDPINLNRIRANIADYIVRQSPGCDNALGSIAFNFPNEYSVYLHDTPDKELFNRNERAFSHGCIRLQNPEEFALLLLKGDGATNQVSAEMHKAMINYKRQRFTLKKPVPIIIQYFTCNVTDGVLVYYKDVYQKDQTLSKRLLGDDVLLASEMKIFTQKKEAGFNGKSFVSQQ